MLDSGCVERKFLFPQKETMSESARIKAEEEVTSQYDEALTEVNSKIKDAFDILKHESLKLHKQRKAFDGVAKKLKHVHFPKTLKLNVGGQVFSTSLETMRKDPGSMLHAMFSGRFDTKAAEDGCYFIDRDGTHFRFILNYLRTGELVVPDDKIVRRELLTEAQFYQVQGILDELKPNSFAESSILSIEQRQILTQWLERKLTSASHHFALIYRGSRNGWGASNFHSCCDHKGPTVTVIRSSSGYIFGGYTEQQWESSTGAFKRDPNSFMFSLVNPSGLKPTKMCLIGGKEGFAIFCNSSSGPVFGGRSGSGHYDLFIGNTPTQSNGCQSNLNNSYRCPEGQNGTSFLAGSNAFNVSEIEVFRLEK